MTPTQCLEIKRQKESQIAALRAEIEEAWMEYRYLGDFAACEIWAARHMTCDTCRVSWTGCWDNFMCPECGEGDLPGSEPTGMTLREMFEEAKSQPNVKEHAPLSAGATNETGVKP